jgi:hypothetical protein
MLDESACVACILNLPNLSENRVRLRLPLFPSAGRNGI